MTTADTDTDRALLDYTPGPLPKSVSIYGYSPKEVHAYASAEVAREVAAAVAKERERCARVCESPMPGLVYKRRPMDWRECAAAIRATPKEPT